MSRIKKLELAKISKPHGLNGEMKLHVHQDASSLVQLSQLYLGDELFTVESIRGSSSKPIIKLDGVDSLEAAKTFQSVAVYALREWLEDSELYISELIDKDVVLASKVSELPESAFAQITAYFEAGSGGLFKLEAGKKEYLIPASPEHWSVIQQNNKTFAILSEVEELLEHYQA